MRDLKNSVADVQAPTRWMRLRVGLVGAVFMALLVGVFARAVVLQVSERERLRSMAQDQYVREIEIPARRGDIFDRRGTALAQSVDVDSIWLDPQGVSDLKVASRELSKILSIDQNELFARLTRARRFAWVKRQATGSEVAKVKALNWPAIGITREPRRFYPQRELGAHVVGLVGTDGHGLDGLELAFEDELSGDKGTRQGFRDARGRKVLTSDTPDPNERQGASVTLTLDRHLQYVTEKALQKAVDDSKAVAGMAVVLDPRTGELLAVASSPRFNPNAPGNKPEMLRNRAVTDLFEPGSTFKSFVVASALDQKVISESTLIDCQKGSMPIGRHVIHDTHPHELLTPGQILKVSSNIGAAKIGAMLGRDRLQETYQRFGFGDRLGLGLPSEGKGQLPYPRAEVSVATQSFGQGLTATAVQIAAAYGALANDGVMMRPYLVSKVTDPDGLVLLENKPTPLRQVVSAKSARSVIAMLEGVVEKEGGGTAPKARMDEYRVAGKTGTAQKVDPVAKGYSEKRVASFIGVVPAENPRAVILVVIDEPKTDTYGGLSAAPAFKEIATAAMPHLGVTPSRAAPPAKPASNLVAEQVKEAPAAVNPVVAAIAALDEVPPSEGEVRVPDVRGLAGRKAIASLMGAALEPRLSGSGRVLAQNPSAGTLVDKGTRVTLELASNLPNTLSR